MSGGTPARRTERAETRKSWVLSNVCWPIIIPSIFPRSASGLASAAREKEPDAVAKTSEPEVKPLASMQPGRERAVASNAPDASGMGSGRAGWSGPGTRVEVLGPYSAR